MQELFRALWKTNNCWTFLLNLSLVHIFSTSLCCFFLYNVILKTLPHETFLNQSKKSTDFLLNNHISLSSAYFIRKLLIPYLAFEVRSNLIDTPTEILILYHPLTQSISLSGLVLTATFKNSLKFPCVKLFPHKVPPA